MKRAISLFAATALFATPMAFGQGTVTFADVGELSGAGATTGTHWKNGVELALKEINASGGILGKKIVLKVYDTQTNPGTAKAMAVKAIDDDAYVVMGPGFSGSMIVSMNETKRAEVPNFTSAEASAITMQGNPYVFRTSLSQATSMPKIAKYIAENAKAKSVAVIYINNDFGKGGRDAIVKELTARGVKIATDIAADPGQLDFSGPVLKAKQSDADVLFPYLTEEESARLLLELRKQNYSKPIIGETTIIEQKVLELAGPAANGVRGHVGLSISAPTPLVKAFAEKFEKEWGYKPNHNAMKGYIGTYVVKAVTEKIGKFDRKAFAQAMKNVKLSAKDYPGVLMDVTYDDKGDIDRESYLVEVKDGKQVILETLPKLKP